MMLFASFCFARLFPLSVSRPVFLPTFPPNSWHSTHPYPSETTPLSFIILLFDAFSRAFCIKKLCKVPHLVDLFHAKSTAMCGTQHVYCTKRRTKSGKMVFQMPLLIPYLLQQPHARIDYLRPMGKLWRARAAIMLKSVPNILLIRDVQPGKKHHHVRGLSLNIVYRGAENTHQQQS